MTPELKFKLVVLDALIHIIPLRMGGNIKELENVRKELLEAYDIPINPPENAPQDAIDSQYIVSCSKRVFKEDEGNAELCGDYTYYAVDAEEAKHKFIVEYPIEGIEDYEITVMEVPK